MLRDMTPPPYTLPNLGASSSHRKAWLDRIAEQSRKSARSRTFAPSSSLAIILIFILAILTHSASALSPVYHTVPNTGTVSLKQRHPRSQHAEPLHLLTRQTPSTTFAMPRAFDASIGNNFTQSACEKWFHNFIEDVYPCHPVSLMLQTSISFFDATKSMATITKVLDASCSVPRDHCSALMGQYAGEILSPKVCGKDYDLQNPVVTQAYAGLLAYQPLYAATCLKSSGSPSQNSGSASALPSATASFMVAGASSTSPASSDTDTDPINGGELGKRQPFPSASAAPSSTSSPSTPPAKKGTEKGKYCYAKAVTNTTHPSASYVYYLPLGYSLPGGTMPACDSCLRDTMKVFRGFAGNSSQPLSGTYGAAAVDVNVFCGPGFVGEGGVVGNDGVRAVGMGWSGVVLAGVLVVWSVC